MLNGEWEMRNGVCGGRKAEGVMWFSALIFLFLLIPLPIQAASVEDPDELYNQGRFQEAEKAYAEADMDNPKDIRHRYNRGCAGYQNSDYKGARAAFSSVLRRTEDKKTRFKAAYNLANTAFKLGDLAGAEALYKQAILIDPENERARYNLEYTLREMEKQKKNKEQQQQQQQCSGDSQQGKEEDPSKGERQEQKQDKSGEGEKPDQKSSDKQDQQEKRAESPQEQAGKQDQGEQTESNQNKAPEEGEDSPRDLSGKLQARQPMPDQGEEGGSSEQAAVLMDQKKAEALLENIKEDRSRLMQFQASKSKESGVMSEKDW